LFHGRRTTGNSLAIHEEQNRGAEEGAPLIRLRIGASTQDSTAYQEGCPQCANQKVGKHIVTEPRAVATGLLLSTDTFNKGPVATRSRFCNGGSLLFLSTFDWHTGL